MAEKKDEVLSVRVSRKIYLPIYLMILILFSIIFYAEFSGKEVNNLSIIGAVAFALIGIFATEIHRLYNRYEINTNALVHVSGIFVKTTRKIDLMAISDADVRQNLWQMLLGYGNVEARLFSKESSTDVNNINNPKEFIRFFEMKLVERRGESKHH